MKVVTFGSSSDNVVIINDDYASPQHCQITQNDNGTFFLLDRDSVNGTFVNDTRITGEVMLNLTDVVRIGETSVPWKSYFADTYTYTMSSVKETPYEPPQNKPNNMLTWAILCTILCCWPFGIPAIVNAAKVDRLWSEGDYEGSRKAAGNAKTWFWMSFAFGLVIGIFYFFIGFTQGLEGLF